MDSPLNYVKEIVFILDAQIENEEGSYEIPVRNNIKNEYILVQMVLLYQ